MVINFNPYYLASAFLVFVAVFMLILSRYLWSLPFFGGALVMFFLGKSKDMDSNGGDDAR